MACERASRREIFRQIRPGPRARLAARLYASGAVPTKRAACEAVGLHPSYITILSSSGNETINRLMAEVDEQIGDETIATAVVIQKLSRKALMTIKDLMTSSNEHISLKAASDILDRNTETSKTLKAQVTTFHIDSEDAKALAAALVEGAKAKEKFAGQALGDVVTKELTDGEPTRSQAQDGSNGSEHHEEHHEGGEEQGRGNGSRGFAERGQTPSKGDEPLRDDTRVLT